MAWIRKIFAESQVRQGMPEYSRDLAIVLKCEGMGDCLFAIAVIKKLTCDLERDSKFVIFTHHPNLFANCPYVVKAHDIRDTEELNKYKNKLALFELEKLPHHLMDTFDFISIPAGIGELSFREKQLEYFPVEEDLSKHFDVVINTSMTWPSRSWPLDYWQRVADFLVALGHSVAIVGKDTWSKSDNLLKKSHGLRGCTDLTNKLSLDQTYYTINSCELFVTCQNGLSVLSGATDTEIVVLDMSIEWSKRAIYRKEDPHYKVTYVKGNCDIYCCQALFCPAYNDFRCFPAVEQVLNSLSNKLDAIKK
jgi:ADP-heptose:LPS heptosyltransferase